MKQKAFQWLKNSNNLKQSFWIQPGIMKAFFINSK